MKRLNEYLRVGDILQPLFTKLGRKGFRDVKIKFELKDGVGRRRPDHHATASSRDESRDLKVLQEKERAQKARTRAAEAAALTDQTTDIYIAD